MRAEPKHQAEPCNGVKRARNLAMAADVIHIYAGLISVSAVAPETVEVVPHFRRPHQNRATDRRTDHRDVPHE